jgi:hypothetical protein
MNNLSASFFAVLLASIAPLRLSAVEPASPFGLTPGNPNSLLPEGEGGLPLIPNEMPPLDVEKKEKKSATSLADDALRERIKLRLAKSKAQGDAELQALWDSSLKARTDFEQREILTKYYTLLCARIAKIDKTLSKETIDTLRAGYLSRYDQTRIAPTVPPTAARARQ